MTTPTWDDLYGEGAAKREAAERIASIATETTLTASELEKLEGMSREGLIALVRRFAGQCGIAAMMTEDETAQAMLDSLAEIALRPIVAGVNLRADISARMSAIDKWLDRTRGKTVQRVEQKVEHSTGGKASELTNEQLMAILSRASVAGLLPAGEKMDSEGRLVTDAEYAEVSGAV